MLNKLKDLFKGQINYNRYHKEVHQNIWIFSSTENAHFNYNSKYLFLYVKDHLPEITPYYVINDSEKRKQLKEIYGDAYFIGNETPEDIEKILSAKVWFTSAGLPLYAAGLKKKHIIINLWHGVPLKKIVLQEEKKWNPAKIYFKYIFTNNYHSVLTSSENMVDIMADSFGIKKSQVKVWGQPRMDALLDPIDRNKYLENALKEELPDYDKVLLYAPTHRDGKKSKLFPFADFNIQDFEDFLERNKILLCIRMHLSEADDSDAASSKWIKQLDNSKVEEVNDVLSIFDMLITDYSSIYIDYLLLNRPILFLAYDAAEYLKTRGLNFSYDEVTPGDKPTTAAEFEAAIQKGLYHDEHGQWRQEVYEFFNQTPYPCSARICSEILKLEEHL